METNSTYYIDLITRYFCGEATPEQIRELEKWVMAEPANKELFQDYRKTWSAIENSKIESSLNFDQEWNALKLNIEHRTSNIEYRKFEIVNQKSKIVNQKSKIIFWSLRVAAALLILAIPLFFLVRYHTPPSEIQLAAGNEVMEQSLPDGTVVTLNAGATVMYPSQFDGSFRKVSLSGEAWFDVAHDKSKPFIISAGNMKIQVVGTSFFVNTRTYKNTREIILSAGHVKVFYAEKPDNAVMLSPGEKAEMITTGYSIVKTANDDENYLAWKTKHMIFTSTPLNEVAGLLTKVYHTRILISDDRLSDCRITATFDKQSLESVLNVLKATLDLQIRNTGAGFELSGHGCR